MTLASVSTFFLPLLGCFAPTLAFVSLNTRFFNTRQIVTSLIASAVLGAIVGAALLTLHAPDLQLRRQAAAAAHAQQVAQGRGGRRLAGDSAVQSRRASG